MKSNNSINFKLRGYTHQNINDEPEIPANRSKLAVKIFDGIFESMFKKHFTSILVKNQQNYYLRNTDYPNILYGFHGCWWDGPLAALICRRLYKCNFYMMIKDLYRFPILSKIGGFSIEKDSLFGKLKAINYTVKLLENPENSVWIFPQGRLYPQDYRPIRFESGIAHICNRLNGVNLIPIAYKYTFLQNEKPEIFVEVGKPIIIENNIDNKKEFMEILQQKFEKLLDNQTEEIIREKFKQYKCLLHNDFSWLRLIENKFPTCIRKNFGSG